jgi:hypothetical protein
MPINLSQRDARRYKIEKLTLLQRKGREEKKNVYRVKNKT